MESSGSKIMMVRGLLPRSPLLRFPLRTVQVVAALNPEYRRTCMEKSIIADQEEAKFKESYSLYSDG